MSDLSKVRPYGDTMNDGIIQLSFTLPIPQGEAVEEAAKLLLQQMGLQEPQVVNTQDLGENLVFIVAYAKTSLSIDVTKLKVDKAATQVMSKQEIEEGIATKVCRKLVVLGACIESDAHTVGIDAIMNMKGYNGHKGLESYHQINAHNLGAQVSCEELVAKAREVQADAILVSQVVTQKNIHIANLTRLVELLEAENLRDRVVLVVGGPRINNHLAKELGYDAGFGPGTYAEDVASYVLQELINREGNGNGSNDSTEVE